MVSKRTQDERERLHGFVTMHPTCQVCTRYTGPQAPHQRIKTTWGGRDEWENLVALCLRCHGRYHEKERAWAPDCIKSPSIKAAILGQAAELVAENPAWRAVLPAYIQAELEDAGE